MNDTEAVDSSKSLPLSGVFDRLVQSNLSLTVSVGRLVTAVYLVLVANSVMTVAFIITAIFKK